MGAEPARERSHPPRETGTLPRLFDAFTQPWATEPAFQLRGALPENRQQTPKKELLVEQRLECSAIAVV
jgi:hypothetical protein